MTTSGERSSAAADNVNAGLAAELQRLQVEQLKLEIRDLRLSWWKRPSWLAACATITAAICGLIWAATTQYFDTRIRELKLETRDFEAARDRQSQAFTRERKAYEARVQKLLEEESRLRLLVRQLDVPIVTRIFFNGTFWTERPSNAPDVLVDGANLGSQEGQLSIEINLRTPTGGRSLTILTCRNVQWGDRFVIAAIGGLNQSSVRTAFADAIRSTRADPRSCMVVALVTIRRHDSLEFQSGSLPVPELNEWLLSRYLVRRDPRSG